MPSRASAAIARLTKHCKCLDRLTTHYFHSLPLSPPCLLHTTQYLTAHTPLLAVHLFLGHPPLRRHDSTLKRLLPALALSVLVASIQPLRLVLLTFGSSNNVNNKISLLACVPSSVTSASISRQRQTHTASSSSPPGILAWTASPISASGPHLRRPDIASTRLDFPQHILPFPDNLLDNLIWMPNGCRCIPTTVLRLPCTPS